MSQPETDIEDTEEADVPDTQLADPDDYHRKQRLKEIHKRRQRVHKIADDMDRYTTSDEHEKQKSSLNDAVSLYIAELEPLIDRTDESPELPDSLPWASVGTFADTLGRYIDEDGNSQSAGYRQAMLVFRQCNRYLADVKPLIEEDTNTEWEV
jgi:hypothetical protein